MSAEFAAFAIVGILFFVADRIYSFIKEARGTSKESVTPERKSIRQIENTNHYNNGKKEHKSGDKRDGYHIKTFLRIIFPKIDHAIAWHRLVTGIGIFFILLFILMLLLSDMYDGYQGRGNGRSDTYGNLSVVVLWITIAYFTIGQRIIYFVAYGDKKEKWQIINKKEK